MTSVINIPAIIIANGMGIAILFVVLVGNFWRFKETSGENKCLLVMFFACVMNCVVDPVCFLVDGKSGLFNRVLVVGCNTLLYFGGILIALAWVFLVVNRLRIKLGTVHCTVLCAIFGVEVILLIINLFKPIMFIVDADNVYARLWGYWIHQALYVIFMFDGLVLYLRYKRASGGLKFFPVWVFIIPVTLGVLIQALYYGVSTATPFTTVSVACVVLCLQNEFMIRDKLTGLYNRYYLINVESKLRRHPNLKYSAIILDVNDFKAINDTYGHNAGDKALIQLASILTESVGKIGEVIRYAGDEFFIIINTQDEDRLKGTIFRINEILDKINNEKINPYEITVAMGYCKIDLNENTMDSYIDIIDKLMYKNKQEYYRTHEKSDRRKAKDNFN